MTFGLEKVSVNFDHIEALDTVTIAAGAGEVTVIVGGDGAGKTTALRCLVGLVKPATGRVNRPEPSRIGYLPAGAGSWRTLTVDENVQFVGRSYGLASTEIESRGDSLLARAGLASARERLAGQLSGGMRTKLGFCLAMLSEPALLVLDEPTTGVDPVSRVEIWRLISETAAEGATVVMATTYMDEAERASTVYLLDRGRLLLEGEPADMVAAMPGAITRTVHPTDPATAWRVGASFHQWWPTGAPEGMHGIDHTLEDAAIVARLGASMVSRGTTP